MQNDTNNLASNMVATYAERAERALYDLKAASIAPAPFKPEWTKRAQAEYDEAIAGMALWSL
jgi:hypothetical protein